MHAMKLLLSILLAFLSSTGLLEFCSRYKFGVGLVELVLDKATQEEVDEHREEFGYQDRFRGFGHRRGFNATMRAQMQSAKECHIACGKDNNRCHMQCFQPYQGLQNKCINIMPFMSCHKDCGPDHACHVRCPMPKCPKMAKKVEEALQCHGSCGADRVCHRACPHPARPLMQKCEMLDKYHTCHKGCGEDRTCHQKCPKMMEIWAQRSGDHRLSDPIHN